MKGPLTTALLAFGITALTALGMTALLTDGRVSAGVGDAYIKIEGKDH